MKTVGSLIVCLVVAGQAPTLAQPAPNVVTDWAAIVQQAIHDSGAPRSARPSPVLQAVVQLAVDDAVDGGYQPYAVAVLRQRGAALWNGSLIALANASALTIVQAARFFAMVLATAADAIIAGFEANYHFSAWQPRTAIRQAN